MGLFATALKNTPFITRIIIFFIIITTAINQYLPQACDILLLNVQPVISHLHVWRVFTCFFYEPNALVALTLIWNMHGMLAKYEFKNSSPVLLVDYFIYALFFSVAFLGISLVHLLLTGSYTSAYMGVFGIMCNFLVKYAYNNYQYKAHLFSIIPLPLYVFPIAIYAIVCLIEGHIRYDGLLGIVVAIPECVFYKSGIILFTLDTYLDKQKFAEMAQLSSLDCWQNANRKKIIQNHRLTVDITQFFENLHIYDPENPPQQPIDESGAESQRSMHMMKENIGEQGEQQNQNETV